MKKVLYFSMVFLLSFIISVSAEVQICPEGFPFSPECELGVEKCCVEGEIYGLKYWDMWECIDHDPVAPVIEPFWTPSPDAPDIDEDGHLTEGYCNQDDDSFDCNEDMMEERCDEITCCSFDLSEGTEYRWGSTHHGCFLEIEEGQFVKGQETTSIAKCYPRTAEKRKDICTRHGTYFASCGLCINPEAELDVCDWLDNDCDGKIDEDCKVIYTVHGAGGSASHFGNMQSYFESNFDNLIEFSGISYGSSNYNYDSASEINTLIKGVYERHKKDNRDISDYYFISHSNGHLVVREGVLLANGYRDKNFDGESDEGVVADPVLSSLYKKFKVVSISPIIGGSTKGLGAPWFLPWWYDVNPAGKHQTWLFGSDMVGKFNGGVSSYSTNQVQMDPHLKGVWKARMVNDDPSKLFFDDDKAQAEYYDRGSGSPNIEYWMNKNKKLDGANIKIDESFILSDSRYEHTVLLDYEPFIMNIADEIVPDGKKIVKGDYLYSNPLTGAVVTEQGEGCSIYGDACYEECYTADDCDSSCPDDECKTICLSQVDYCTSTCDFFYDYCQEREVECDPGDQIFIYDVAYYCDEKGETMPEKPIGEECNNDYECSNKNCDESYCKWSVSDIMQYFVDWFDGLVNDEELSSVLLEWI